MNVCQYEDCQEQAVAKGFVYTMDKEFKTVHACKEHRNTPSFFEVVEVKDDNNE